ncbi:hypothetical protein SAMN05421639_101725 [Chryseobacterium shigense]|uniref:Uncharacterized protein n=1 Tax=Chryseobacterium shigense TaxID=297244 RepID=A0A1N7HZA2_9FLAO|nr:hypothetical protein SAMN05421639_101725 [Chryseobacterium shigense]
MRRGFKSLKVHKSVLICWYFIFVWGLAGITNLNINRSIKKGNLT